MARESQFAGNKETSEEGPGREGLWSFGCRETRAVCGHLRGQVRGSFSLAGSGLTTGSVVDSSGWSGREGGRAGAGSAGREQRSWAACPDVQVWLKKDFHQIASHSLIL